MPFPDPSFLARACVSTCAYIFREGSGDQTRDQPATGGKAHGDNQLFSVKATKPAVFAIEHLLSWCFFIIAPDIMT